MYVQPTTAFTGDSFSGLREYLSVGGEGSPLVYDDDEQVVMRVAGTVLELSAVPPPTGQAGRPFRRPRPVDSALMDLVVPHVKETVAGAAEDVLADLTRRFPPETVLDALSCVYADFWREKRTVRDLLAKVEALKPFFGVSKAYHAAPAAGTGGGGPSSGGGRLEPLIDMAKLRDQAVSFKVAAGERAQLLFKAMERGAKFPRGTFTALWTDLTRDAATAESISEYARLARLAATIVPGSVEAERVFSSVSYIKNKQRNRLQQPHLSACVRLKVQEWFGVANFPYAKALKHWKEGAQYRHAEYQLD